MEKLENARVIEPMVLQGIGLDTAINTNDIKENKPILYSNADIKNTDIFMHDFDYVNSVNRLKEEALKHDLIIAFDFDNTLHKYIDNANEYSIENVYQNILNLLLDCQSLNMILVLYTVVTDKAELDKKVDFCKSIGLNIKYINKSPIFNSKLKTSKIYYNILLDDRAGLSTTYQQLKEVVEYIKGIKKLNNNTIK